MQRTSLIKGILFFLLFTFAFGLFMVRVCDPDFWWHLKTGEWIVEHKELPKEDPFSFTTLQKDPYTPIDRVKFILTQYWLAQIIMYKIYALWGFAGISIFRSLILILTMGIIVLILRKHKVNDFLILPIALTAAIMFRGGVGERPQLFSFLFAALLIYLLERYRKRSSEFGVQSSGIKSSEHSNPPSSPFSKGEKEGDYFKGGVRELYAIPPLMVLWSNLHGGYIYGIAILLIYMLSGWINILIERFGGKSDTDIRQQFIFTAVGIIAVLASFINPNTYYGIIDQFRYQPITYMRSIQEMKPTYIYYKVKPEYFITLILLTLLIIVDIIRKRRADTCHILLFIFNAALSLSAVRFVPFFAISGSFLLGIYLNAFLYPNGSGKKIWIKVIPVSAVFLFIAGFALYSGAISAKDMYRTDVEYGRYPYGATNILKALPPKRIFNAYGWGGYLIWNLYPSYQVFIDGRGLNQEIFLQYGEVLRADKSGIIPKWKAILDGYQIDYLLLCPAREGTEGLNVISELIKDQDWRLIYADSLSLLYIRNKEEFKDIIGKYNLPPELAYETILVQAIEVANASLTRNDKVVAYMIAADMSMRLNMTKDARDYAKKALELVPDNPHVKSFAIAIGAE